jgi:hypothetical protein
MTISLSFFFQARCHQGLEEKRRGIAFGFPLEQSFALMLRVASQTCLQIRRPSAIQGGSVGSKHPDYPPVLELVYVAPCGKIKVVRHIPSESIVWIFLLA